ncbi:MAG: hypothetical protein ACREC9_08000 [Methylocella sp.]
MDALKLAFLGSLRIAFFGSLKIALCTYTLFLSDTAFAGARREGNGQVGDTASYTAGAASRRKNTGLLNENYLTPTGETVAHPGESQGAATTDLDRRIEQQNDRVEQNICSNCN